jgi:hypothetical protein
MAPKKRKKSSEHPNDDSKRARAESPAAEPRSTVGSLQGPHESAIEKLQTKYNVLAISVISSSKIRKRVGAITDHLVTTASKEAETPTTRQSNVVLLYARPAEVCKLITVTEQSKRLLKGEGKAVYQYNELFQLPPPPQKPETVEETVLVDRDDRDSSSSDDGFEPLESRLEKAVQTSQPTRTSRSLRVFLSCTPVPELKANPGVTVQATENTLATSATGDGGEGSGDTRNLD